MLWNVSLNVLSNFLKKNFILNTKFFLQKKKLSRKKKITSHLIVPHNTLVARKKTLLREQSELPPDKASCSIKHQLFSILHVRLHSNANSRKLEIILFAPNIKWHYPGALEEHRAWLACFFIARMLCAGFSFAHNVFVECLSRRKIFPLVQGCNFLSVFIFSGVLLNGNVFTCEQWSCS